MEESAIKTWKASLKGFKNMNHKQLKIINLVFLQIHYNKSKPEKLSQIDPENS